MDRQVGALIFLFICQAQPGYRLDHAVHQQTTGKGDDHTGQRANQLRHEAHAAQTAQRFGAKDTGRQAAPHTAQAVQRPDTQHVINLEAVLGQDKGPDKQATSDRTGRQRAQRMHQVGAGTHRHQPCQRAVMNKARVGTPHQQRHQGATDHRHQ